jgi:glycosyltransferase involved in cell wall biosynthesis
MTSSTDRRAPAPPHGSSISVVVPTFNDAGRIIDALGSIAAQSLRPAEIVVCDDGSDDLTEQVVRAFAAGPQARDIPVRYIRLAERSGVVAARNEGIAAARNEWIAECDSDDTWAPQKLERQAAFVRAWQGRRPLVLLGTHGYNMNDAKRVVSRAAIGPTSEQDYESVRRRHGLFFVIHSSVLFHRSDFDAVDGYKTDYGAADEFDFFGRMAERGAVINLAEPLVYYRKRSGSMQLDRFWDKERGALRVAENQRRRATGQAQLSSEEFAAWLAGAPLRERLRRRRQTLGMYYYRSGAAQAVNGRRIQGGSRLLLAGLLDGALVRAGVRNAVRSRRSASSRAHR